MSRVLHLEPIGACDPYIAHAALDLRRERTQSRGIDDTIHLDVLKRFQPQFLVEGLLAALGCFAPLAYREQISGAVARHHKDGVR